MEIVDLQVSRFIDTPAVWELTNISGERSVQADKPNSVGWTLINS